MLNSVGFLTKCRVTKNSRTQLGILKLLTIFIKGSFLDSWWGPESASDSIKVCTGSTIFMFPKAAVKNVGQK